MSSVIPGRVDLLFVKGCDFSKGIVVAKFDRDEYEPDMTAAEVQALPSYSLVDLSVATFAEAVGRASTDDDTEVWKLELGAGFTPGNGSIDLEMAKADVNALEIGSAEWSARVTVGGVTDCYLIGSYQVLQGASHD